MLGEWEMRNCILDDLIGSVKTQNLNVLNVIVRKAGDIIAEHDFEEEKPTLLWSVRKTFTSIRQNVLKVRH